MQILLFLFFVSLQTAHCRWATMEEAEYRVLKSQVQVEIDSSGRAVYTTEREIEILKEGARRSAGIYRLDYNSRASSVDILGAWVENKGKKVEVDSKFIEDKPLASDPSGFDVWNQVIVAYPQVDIGSKLFIKIREEEKEIPFENYTFDSYSFGFGEREESSDVLIHSKKKLYFAVNDPRQELLIESSEDAHRLHITTKKPLFYHVIEETKSITPRSKIPWVDISSNDKPKEILDIFIHKYENRLSAKLPPLLQEILAEAQSTHDFFSQVDAVTIGLQKRTHYLGDWRPIHGGHVPRTLEEIARTRFGDCKDFALSTVAVLRALGFDANIALVHRGDLFVPRPTSMPSLTRDYNHAIVHIQHDGKEYWVDPTNQVSFVHGIFPDIADRPALILDVRNSRIARIPAIESSKNKTSSQKQIRFTAQNNINIDVSLTLFDTAAIPVTGVELFRSKKETEFYLLGFVTRPKEVKKYAFKPFDLRNRSVDTKSISLQYDVENFLEKTSTNYAYSIPRDNIISDLFFERKDRVSDLHLSRSAFESEENYFLISTKLIGKRSLTCSVQSDWLDAERSVRQVKADIEIKNRYRLKKNYVTVEEIQSQAFQKLQENLRGCFRSSAAMIKNDLFR